MKSASAEPGPRPTSCQPSASIFAVSRLCLSSERITSSVKSSMPQSVWWTTNHSSVPSSLWEITSERMASSLARPPALRITWASPSLRPANLAGSSRASMQVRIAKRRAGGKGKLALLAEIPGIGRIRCKDFCVNFRHDALLKAGVRSRMRGRRASACVARSSSALRVWQKRSRRASNRLARKALPR